MLEKVIQSISVGYKFIGFIKIVLFGDTEPRALTTPIYRIAVPLLKILYILSKPKISFPDMPKTMQELLVHHGKQLSMNGQSI